MDWKALVLPVVLKKILPGASPLATLLRLAAVPFDQINVATLHRQVGFAIDAETGQTVCVPDSPAAFALSYLGDNAGKVLDAVHGITDEDLAVLRGMAAKFGATKLSDFIKPEVRSQVVSAFRGNDLQLSDRDAVALSGGSVILCPCCGELFFKEEEPK